MPRPERALDTAEGTVAQFAAGLRELREKAGRPGYRELAGHAHFSVTTLSVAAAGRKLPSLDVVLAYVRACGGDVTEWELRWRAAAGELGEPAADVGPPHRAEMYGPNDAPRLAGRERAAGELVASAEAVWAELAPDEQRITTRVLLWMLDISPRGVTPRRVMPADLDQGNPATAAVVERLIAGRVLDARGDTVGLADDSLITSWPRLRSWVDAWLAQQVPSAVDAQQVLPAVGDDGLATAKVRARRRAVMAAMLVGVIGIGAAVQAAFDRPALAPPRDPCATVTPAAACPTEIGWRDGRADLFVHEGTNVAVRFQQDGGFDAGRGITHGFGRFHGRELPDGLGGLHFADLDGDRRTDMVVHEKGDLLLFSSNGTKLVRGPVISSGWDRYHGRSAAGDLGTLHFADFDADGRADLIVHRGAEVSVHRYDGAAFGAGRVAGTGWGRFAGVAVNGRFAELHFADFNADGRADLITHDGSDVSVHLNDGVGFGTGRVVSTGWGRFHGREAAGQLGRLYFADFDGDRRTDLIVHEGDSLSVRLNTGVGFDLGRGIGAGWALFHGKRNAGHLGRVYLG